MEGKSFITFDEFAAFDFERVERYLFSRLLHNDDKFIKYAKTYGMSQLKINTHLSERQMQRDNYSLKLIGIQK